MSALRLSAVVALPLLAACAVTVPIDVVREVAVDASAAGAFAAAEAVDLSASSGSLWVRRGQLDAVSVDEVTATVVAISSGSGAALNLLLAFRPEGAPSDGSQDVAVGSLAGLVVTPGAAAVLPGSSKLDAFLLSVVKGSGRFTAVASGSVSAAVNAVLRVEVKGSATAKVGG